MPRMPLHISSGIGMLYPKQPKSIRLVRYGCTNRPFYHIVVMNSRSVQRAAPIEQLGSYDPIENERNEKLVAFDYERIQYWIGQGNVTVSKPVEQLLGLSGFFPIHPTTYMTAWRKRKAEDEAAARAKEEAAKEDAAASEGSN